MFGYDVFGSPVRSFRSESAPTILVKINNGMVKHQLPNWSGDTWTSYGPWSTYLNTAYVKNRTEGATVGSYTFTKHCVLIHESDDTNVPAGTKYGSACPADIVAKTCPENATIVDGLCECDSGFLLVKGICQPTSSSTSGRSSTTQNCDDSNRETNSDGSCASSCKSGYVFDSANLCVPEEDGVIECTDALRQSNSDGSCAANCLSGHDFNSAGLCEEVESEEGLPWGTIGFFGGLGLLTLLVIR